MGRSRSIWIHLLHVMNFDISMQLGIHKLWVICNQGMLEWLLHYLLRLYSNCPWVVIGKHLFWPYDWDKNQYSWTTLALKSVKKKKMCKRMEKYAPFPNDPVLRESSTCCLNLLNPYLAAKILLQTWRLSLCFNDSIHYNTPLYYFLKPCA